MSTKAKKKSEKVPEKKIPSKSKNEHHEEFVNLYTSDEDGSTIDMTTLERKSTTRSTIAWFVVIILVLSAVAAGLGYMVFGPNRQAQTSGDVTLELESVSEVGSGDQVELTIHYTNSSKAAIASGTIEMVFPQGFYFRSSDPQPRDASTNKWDVSGIAGGTEGTIVITGQLVGQKDEEKSFTALFTYTPENFSSDFQQSAHATIRLTDSIITLEAQVPEQARTGETITYTYTFTNTSTLPLVDVRAFVDYPDGFNPTGADPTASKSNHTWVFDEIAPNESQTVNITGTVSADGGQTLSMITQVGLQEPDGFFNIQTEVSDDIIVVNPELSLSLTAPEFAQPGESVSYDIVVENISEVEIENIDLLLTFSGKAVDSSEVALDTIESIEPDAKVTLTHSATVKTKLPADATSIVATLKITNASVGGTTVEFLQTAETTTQLQGTITLNTEARYYDDDLTKIGDGPLPPQVGSTTTYVLRWTIAASGGDMKNIEVKTKLPDGVTFDAANSNDIHYSDNTVTWQVETLNANATEQADFSVSVTPSKADKNKLLVLLNEVILTAVDSQSDETIQAQTKQVTSKLTNDPGANDDGAVVGKTN